jgi:hypothetical protein
MSNLSGQYKVISKPGLTGRRSVYIVDPETGVVIGSILFSPEITEEDKAKVEADIAAGIEMS